ncbi:DMT family transporter [Candidatus Harpocratesius sp.]
MAENIPRTVVNSNTESSAGNSSRFPSYLGIIFLLITTILWGSTFTITNQITQYVSPMFYMAIRYLIGFLVFLPFFHHFRQTNLEFWKITLKASSLLWASFALQTIGIQLTTAAKSAFITGLNVIMVPIFAALIYRQKVRKIIWISTLLALIGISLMSLSGLNRFEFGDFLVFLCDIFYALYILYLEKKLPHVDLIAFSAFQLAFLSCFSFIASFIFENSFSKFTLSLISLVQPPFGWYILYMGLIATSAATLFQMKGQKMVSATQAAIVFALEPIFGAFFAVIIGNEELTWQIIVGGTLIMAGIFLTIEILPKNRQNLIILSEKS